MPTTTLEERLIPRSALRHRPITTTDGAHLEIPSWIPPRSSRNRESRSTPLRKPPESIPSIQPHSAGASQPRFLLIGIGMLLAVVLVSDDLAYGRPRLFRVQAFVGHEQSATPSLFLALNVHGRVEVIELPGGDASNAWVFLGPQLTGPNADLIPVTLQFVDVNKDHRLDMLVLFHGTQVVFRNTQKTFVPQ